MKHVNALSMATMLLAFAVAGCTSGSTPNQGGGIDEPEQISPSEAVAEYEEWTKKLALPDGVIWLHGLGPTRDENFNVIDEHVPAGSARVMAELYWFCAWQWKYLSQYGKDDASARATMQKLQGLKQMKAYIDLVDKEVIDDMLTKAALGDLTVMKFRFDGGCTHLVYASPSPSTSS